MPTIVDLYYKIDHLFQNITTLMSPHDAFCKRLTMVFRRGGVWRILQISHISKTGSAALKSCPSCTPKQPEMNGCFLVAKMACLGYSNHHSLWLDWDSWLIIIIDTKVLQRIVFHKHSETMTPAKSWPKGETFGLCLDWRQVTVHVTGS